MIKHLLTYIVVIISFSSCSHSNTMNYGLEHSDIGNLSFKDIRNLKEYKRCSTGSIGFSNLLLSHPFIPNVQREAKYEMLRNNLTKGDGDSSISSAVKLGGIGEIKLIDHTYEIAGLFKRKYCIIVYGEE